VNRDCNRTDAAPKIRMARDSALGQRACCGTCRSDAPALRKTGQPKAKRRTDPIIKYGLQGASLAAAGMAPVPIIAIAAGPTQQKVVAVATTPEAIAPRDEPMTIGFCFIVLHLRIAAPT
jgi:hypothetical protein